MFRGFLAKLSELYRRPLKTQITQSWHVFWVTSSSWRSQYELHAHRWFQVQPPWSSTLYLSPVCGNHHNATRNHMPYGITQCYLPPGSRDFPDFTSAKAGGTRFSNPGGMQGWVDLGDKHLRCVFESAINIRRVCRFHSNVTTLRSGMCHRLSVCMSVVCLSVCNVRAPYLVGSDLRQYFYAILYPSHSLTRVQNFTEIVSGEPLRRG